MTENFPVTRTTTPTATLQKKAVIDAECRNDLQCRIDALQTIVRQLLTENERLRTLMLQLP